MFISRLKDKLQDYDKYGEHRTNGLKALYVFELMLVFELFSSIPQPYFYYFFVPLTCLNAEIVGSTIQEKYLFLLVSLLGSAVTIFLFGVFSVYKTFFVFFVFFYSATFYYLFILKYRRMLTVVPLILGLGSYSLIDVDADANFYIALNNALQTIVAIGVIFAGLYLFPNTYYLAIWRRAFCDVMMSLETLCINICHEDVKNIGICPGIVVMKRYSKMLPRKTKSYSTLKITLLTFELVMSMSYLISFQKQYRLEYVKVLHQYLERLRVACKTQEPVILKPQECSLLTGTRELWVLYKLILSWNYLCTK